VCTPGWTPTSSNIAILLEKLKKVPSIDEAVVVLDLVSNVVFRFEDLECLYLPIKVGRQYHMAGTVTVCSKESLNSILNSLKPIFDLCGGHKIVLPALPRYLFDPCCSTVGHCIGMGSDGYATNLLSKGAAARKVLKDHMISRYANVTVPDTLSLMFPECVSPESLCVSLKQIFSKDAVHFTEAGYSILGEVVQTIVEEKSAGSLVSGSSCTGQSTVYYWKGFASPVGTARPVKQATFHGNRQLGKWRGSSSASRGRHAPYTSKRR